MVAGIQRIQCHRAVRGGQPGFSLPHVDGETAVLSQYPCIAGRERERTLVFLKCARELQRPFEEDGQGHVAFGESRRQGNRFSCDPPRALLSSRERRVPPLVVQRRNFECKRPAGIGEGVSRVQPNGLGVIVDGNLQILFVRFPGTPSRHAGTRRTQPDCASRPSRSSRRRHRAA